MWHIHVIENLEAIKRKEVGYRLGSPGSSAGKESACDAADLGSIPGLGSSLEEGKGYALQYSGLENSMDCIAHMGPQRTGHDWATFTFTTDGSYSIACVLKVSGSSSWMDQWVSCAGSAASAAFYHPESFNITACGVAIPSVGALTAFSPNDTVFVKQTMNCWKHISCYILPLVAHSQKKGKEKSGLRISLLEQNPANTLSWDV